VGAGHFILLALKSVGNVRIGKYIEMDIDTDVHGEAERMTKANF